MAIPVILGGEGLLPVLNRLSLRRLLVLLAMILVAWNLNAGRLRLLAGGVGYRLGQCRALAIVMATEFAISATPGGTGGPLTYSWLLQRHPGIPGARGVALYAADQLMDMVFFATALLGFSLYWLLVPSDLHLGWQVAVAAGLLSAGLLGVGWALRHYRSFLLATGRLLQRLSLSAAHRRRLARWALEFRRSLRLVRLFHPLRLGAIYALCLGHWMLRYSILYLAVQGVGGHVAWSYAFLVQMLSLAAGHTTLLPGGAGGAEASSGLLLLPYLDPATAAAAILVWRFVTFYWYLVAGAPVFALLAGRPLWARLRGQTRPD